MSTPPTKTDQTNQSDESKQQPQTGELDAEKLDEVAGGSGYGVPPPPVMGPVPGRGGLP